MILLESQLAKSTETIDSVMGYFCYQNVLLIAVWRLIYDSSHNKGDLVPAWSDEILGDRRCRFFFGFGSSGRKSWRFAKHSLRAVTYSSLWIFAKRQIPHHSSRLVELASKNGVVFEEFLKLLKFSPYPCSFIALLSLYNFCFSVMRNLTLRVLTLVSNQIFVGYILEYSA